MNEEERAEFDAMKERIAYYDELFEKLFGGSPERIGQIIVQQRVDGSVAVGGRVRVTTSEGEFDFLIA